MASFFTLKIYNILAQKVNRRSENFLGMKYQCNCASRFLLRSPIGEFSFLV
jgi:hypothetical protein